ncbi:MAG TPA: hypothetical protein VH092_22760 [Urbifossiella sp.]|jgi:hypothetical protein|nr:hypothetical protein [Urbifossiella sp.]
MSTPPARRGPGSALRVEQLEDRTVPSFSPFQATGGESIAIGNVVPEASGPAVNEYVVGAGPGQSPFVRIYDTSGNLEFQFMAYESTYTGGVNVAVGNVVVDPATGSVSPEIITGTGPGGGPLVKVFSPSTGKVISQFFAYETTFRGGVNVAAGQLNAGSTAEEIVTGSGFGGGPVVRVFTGAGKALSSFYAYESTFRNGVNVAAGDAIPTGPTGANAGDEIVTGPGEGGSPLLRVFSSRGALLQSYFAFDSNDRNGLVVTIGTTAGPTTSTLSGQQIFAAEQFTPLSAAPRVRGFNGADEQVVTDFSPYPAGYTRYLNLAVGEVASDPSVAANLNSGDLVVVAGEGPVGQVPLIQYGKVGSAAGNNGP